jgi:hypothetical protein
LAELDCLVAVPERYVPVAELDELAVGVQVDYNLVHLRTFLVQLFVLLQNFEEVQIIALKRFGCAPNDYPFAPLTGRIHGVGRA